MIWILDIQDYSKIIGFKNDSDPVEDRFIQVASCLDILLLVNLQKRVVNEPSRANNLNNIYSKQRVRRVIRVLIDIEDGKHS